MAVQIPPGVIDIIKSVAPTLLAALSGPAAVVVAPVVSAALEKWLPPGTDPAKAKPADIVTAMRENISDRAFILALKDAENTAKQYELESETNFQRLAVEDRQGARAMVRDTGMAKPQFIAGMSIIALAMTMLFGVVVLSVLMVNGSIQVDPASASVTVAVFGLLNGITGALQAIAIQILAFYFGSSAGSAEKSAQLDSAIRDMGSAINENAKAAPAKVPPVVVTPIVTPPTVLPDDGDGAEAVPAQPIPPIPAKPAPAGLLTELLPGLVASHKHFPDGASWELTPTGISVDGAPAQGTPGQPVTCRTVWGRYGDLMSAAAKQYGVPVELIMMTCLAESRGDPNARRAEPKISDQSVGLMQTLVRTARSALGRNSLQADDLLDPATSINAGTAYIAQQRASTHFDPVLVAAAYNAGSLKRDSGPANRWKLLVYPTGTGQHIDNSIAWFGDAMRVSAEMGWGKQEGVPSFASCFPQNGTR